MLTSKRQTLGPLVMGAVALTAAQIVLRLSGKDYCLTQLTMAVYYSIVVIGLCLVMGFAGQVSLGHGAFFAIGGYTSAILTTSDFSRIQQAPWAAWLKGLHVFTAQADLYGNPMLTVSPWAAFFLALLVTLILACAIGYPALRLKGHYLAMATLAFGLVVHRVILGTAVTGATDGISSVPAWNLGLGLVVSDKNTGRVQNYYVACGLTLLMLVLLGNLARSRVGRALQAIHDRELAANAMGINTAAYKLKAFVISAMLAALAGILLTHYTGRIDPSEAGALKSVRYVALAAAGGMGNPWGVAFVSIGLNYLSLRGYFGSYDHAVFGVILIAIVSLAPDGPLKPLGNWVRRLVGRLVGKSRKGTGGSDARAVA
jgi:branched-chain amino acid transport system permease protein